MDDALIPEGRLPARRAIARRIAGRCRYLGQLVREPRLSGPRFVIGRRARIDLGVTGRLERKHGLVFDDDLFLVLHATASFGENCYVNRGAQIAVYAGLRVGDNCRFGERLSIHDEDHVKPGDGDPGLYRATPITIGNDVWVGANVTITRGVVIGDKAVVAAGAVVTRDVEAGTVVAGVPARPIG